MEIRRQLTVEEEKGELASAALDSSDSFTETKYLLYGLDLEEQQYASVGLSLIRGTDCVLGANCSLCLHR